ncbi:MAG: hypothetical protein ACHQK8_01850 [Bacteroidia bacterium]
MKKYFIIYTAVIALLLVPIIFFTSCSKDSTATPASTAAVAPLGDLKVSVHFAPDSTSAYGLYIKGDFSVKLFDKNNNSIATQFTTGNSSNLDFGNYVYDTYTIKIHGDTWSYLSGGSSIHDHFIDSAQTFSVDAPTKTVTFVVK